MKIQAITDGETSAINYWMSGIAKHSKHDISIRHFGIDKGERPDLIYFHYGSMILEGDNEAYVKAHPEIKYGFNIAGPLDFSRMVWWINASSDNKKITRGVMMLGKKFESDFKAIIPDVPTYITEIGVDMSLFPRETPPRHFIVGYAENNNYPLTDGNLHRLIKCGFPIILAGNGKGTDRGFSEMPAFYKSVSVFIDPTVEPRPGGLMFLEAASTGRPVVAMKSGILANWFPEEFLVEDDAGMVKKLGELKNPDYYNYASTLWYEVAKSRDYSIVAGEYDRAFEEMVK